MVRLSKVAKIFILSLIAVSLLALSSCQPTGVPICDRNVAALVVAEAERYRYDCTPTEVSLPPNKGGWHDAEHRVLYVLPDTADFTTKVMWHELGHGVYTNRYGLGGTQAQREDWADAYAWCHWPIAGMSYRVKPVNCGPYM